MKWYVEKFMFEDRDSGGSIPIDAFEGAGVEVEEIFYIPFVDGRMPKNEKEEKAVVYASINAAIRMLHVFGCYMRPENFRHHVYFSNFKGDYLNDNCFYMPFGKIEEYLNENMSDVDVFVRPDSGMKGFTGLVVKAGCAEKEFDHIHQLYNIMPEELVVVSPVQKIKKEYRSIVVGDRVVEISLYRKDDKHFEERGAPQEVWDFCQKMVDQNPNWRPDNAFTLDVAETGSGELKIIELNSFSSAGWYKCDPCAIITAVTDLTEKIWEEQYGESYE